MSQSLTYKKLKFVITFSLEKKLSTADNADTGFLLQFDLNIQRTQTSIAFFKILFKKIIRLTEHTTYTKSTKLKHCHHTIKLIFGLSNNENPLDNIVM